MTMRLIFQVLIGFIISLLTEKSPGVRFELTTNGLTVPSPA